MNSQLDGTIISLHSPVLMDNSRLREENPSIALHFKASEDELLTYPKIGNLIVDANYIEWVPCPSCGCDHTQQLFIKWGIQYDQCPVCSHVYAKNRLRQSILDGLYKNSISDELDRAVNQHPFNQMYWSRVYEKYIDYFIARFGVKLKLLDVGCGIGSFIKSSRTKGVVNCHGLDVYERLTDVLSSIVPMDHIHQVDSFYDARLTSDFDVLTMWGVLEHLANPADALRKSRDCLKMGGIVAALVPNLNSRAFKIFGINTPTLNPRQHINFVTRQSMEYMCHISGFKVLDVINELPVIDIMYGFVNYSDEFAREIARLDESYYHVYILEKI